MPFTQYLDNILVNLFFGSTGAPYTPATPLYYALSTTVPTQAKGSAPYWNFTEPSTVSTAYARVSVANTTANFPNGTVGTLTNGAIVAFPAATASWGTVTYFGIFDSATVGAGNCLGYGILNVPQAIAGGDTLSFAIGAITISNV